MISAFHKSLAKKRAMLENDEKGFTLIELLVVVLIIGILAAIAIPVFLSQQNNARNSSVQSDLTNAKTAIISVQTTTGNLPASALDVSPTITAADGYTRGDNTSVIKYFKGTTSGFCLVASVTGGDSSQFYVLDSGGVVKVDATHALPSTCK